MTFTLRTKAVLRLRLESNVLKTPASGYLPAFVASRVGQQLARLCAGISTSADVIREGNDKTLIFVTYLGSDCCREASFLLPAFPVPLSQSDALFCN
jgi:hypothetical protein